VIAGMIGAGTFAFLVAALMWGRGKQVFGVDEALDSGQLPNTVQTGVAWLAAVILLLLVVYALLPFATRYAPAPRLVKEMDAPSDLLVAATVLLPHLETVLPERTAERVRSTESRLNSLLVALVSWILVGVLLALLALLSGPAWGVALLIVLVAGAMAAQSWELLDHAIAALWKERIDALELHRFDILRALHLPLPNTPAEELALYGRLGGGRAQFEGVRYEHEPEGAQVDPAELRASLTSALEEFVSEPPLVNFSGWVAVSIDTTGRMLRARDGTAVIQPGRYSLRVSFSGNRPEDAVASEALAISDGLTAPEAPFRLELDSTGLNFGQLHQDVTVSTHEPDASFVFEFSTPHQPGGRYPIWVQILQSTRLLQVVLLTVEVQSGERRRGRR
jgi:hypothetical protein